MIGRIALGLGLLAGLVSTALGDADETLIHVQITTQDAPAVAWALEREGFDVVEGSVQEGQLDVIASPEELSILEDRGFQIFVIDVGRPFRDIQEEQDIPPGYLDLAGIVNQLQQTAATYPSICKFVDLTTEYGAPVTYQNRHMCAVKISDNVEQDEDEPTFLLVACHHAREIVTPVIALYALQQFTTKYGVDPRYTTLVDNYEIWIAPVWNPDGYEYMYYTNNNWRKNRRVFATGTGVDLNRNYPFGWSTACAGSTNPSSDTYKGPSPASESETQTMILWSNDRHWTKVVDYHSYGREVLRGYACLTYPFSAYLTAEATAISQASGYGGAIREPSAEGEEQMWQMATRCTYGFLIETHTSFQPTYASAQTEAQMVFPGVLFMLERPIPLSGHVTDARTGAPLRADIELVGVNFPNGETNYSHERFGRYHVFAPAGNYNIKFSATGYVSKTVPVTIVANTATVVDVGLSKPFLVGDINCDGNVDFGDINPFVLALTNPAAYVTLYPNCPFENRDINGDGFCDFGDINPFVRLLTGP
ncbi:MAG: M14 family zinc carboxypeptidase [Planctomycetota bacterium]